MPKKKGPKPSSIAVRSALQQCRTVALNLAVNCRKSLDDIERISRWRDDVQLAAWHGYFTDLRSRLASANEMPTGAPPEPLPQASCLVGEGSGSVGGGATGAQSVGATADALSTSTRSDLFSDWTNLLGSK